MVADDHAFTRISVTLDLANDIPNRVNGVVVVDREIELCRTWTESCEWIRKAGRLIDDAYHTKN